MRVEKLVVGLLVGGALLVPASAAHAAAASNGPILIRTPDYSSRSLWAPDGSSHAPFALEQEYEPLAFAPDGASVAYLATYNQTSAQINIRGADGSDHVAGTVLGNEVYQVSFSGDGSQLAVFSQDYSTDAPQDRISVLSASGTTAPRVILDDIGDQTLITGASWDPGSNEIAFIRNGIIGLISATNPSGGVHSFAEPCSWIGANVDPNDNGCWSSGETFDSVSFSPTGGKVVGQYFTYDGLGNSYSYIGVQTRGVPTPHQVASVPPYTPGATALESSAFSPDGTRVVYTLRHDDLGNVEVRVAPAAGSGSTQVAPGQDPLWLPCPGGVCADWSEKVGTTVSATAPSPRGYGKTVPIRIDVYTDDGSTPTGPVTVSEGGSKLGTVNLSGGSATFVVPAPTTLGTHTYTVSYAGGNGLSGSSTTVTVSVRAASALAGHISALTWQRGAKVFVTGTLTTTPATTATGPMKLMDGTKVLRSATLVASNNNKLIFQVPALTKGTHRIRLKYAGSPTVMPAVTGTAICHVI